MVTAARAAGVSVRRQHSRRPAGRLMDPGRGHPSLEAGLRQHRPGQGLASGKLRWHAGGELQSCPIPRPVDPALSFAVREPIGLCLVAVEASSWQQRIIEGSKNSSPVLCLRHALYAQIQSSLLGCDDGLGAMELLPDSGTTIPSSTASKRCGAGRAIVHHWGGEGHQGWAGRRKRGR